jgi:ATP-dependent DNA helicase RecG
LTTRIPEPSQYPSPAATIGLAGAIESALELLRLEWRQKFHGLHAERAIRAVQYARTNAPLPPIAGELTVIQSRLEAYLTLPERERPKALKEIGTALRSLQASGLLLGPAAPQQKLEHKSPAHKPPAARQLQLDAPVNALPRVGPAVAKKLGKLGIRTVADLLRATPRRHIDYSKTLSIRDASGFTHRGEVTIQGTVREVTPFAGPPSRVTIRLVDRTGALRVTWFNPYIANQLRPGDEIAVSGVLDRGYGSPSMTGPEWEKVGSSSLSTGRLTPVYNLTHGLAQKSMRSLTRAALDATKSTLVDPVPAWVRDEFGLVPLVAAFEESHYPQSEQNRAVAMKRLSFDELLLLQLGMGRIKRERAQRSGASMPADRNLLDRFTRGLPFALTGAQQRAIAEILDDLARPAPMMRLLQGDVGSGKTVVAAASALIAVSNGFQVAVMAPTEILAEQHFATFQSAYPGLDTEASPSIALLTGSTPRKRRSDILHGLREREIDVLVGTQALIQDGVEFARLGLLVVDEQHRFGVRQRAHLVSEVDGVVPHVLAMTATPIPRTLNMVLNGDSEVSVIDQLPEGRVPIETRRYAAQGRAQAYELVRSEIAVGRQAFVICPLVDESESTDARAATSEAERLQRLVFPELTVQVLHGRMSGKEKDRIMAGFRAGDYDILVSTSVIEVGIDVPNATIMMIEGANRFGLAQLHQFRGRVGRGSHRSYCLLIADDSTSDAEARLEMMTASSDGFALAEKDLELRGPGDFIGTRQSGLPAMSALATTFDTRVLDAARRAASLLLDRDPELQAAEYAPLRHRLREFWASAAPDIPLSQ